MRGSFSVESARYAVSGISAHVVLNDSTVSSPRGEILSLVVLASLAREAFPDSDRKDLLSLAPQRCPKEEKAMDALANQTLIRGVEAGFVFEGAL